MNRTGVAQCALAAVLFGASAPLAARLAESIPAFTLAGLLYIGAALAVAPAVRRRPPTWRAVRTEWKPAAIAVIAGGTVGPVLLVAGLARTDAATASILLNTELAATVVLAGTLFREHLGGRLLVGAGMITVAGGLLSWEPGATIDLGAVLVVAACASWGVDNCVTARIEQLAPEHVVAAKGVVAGGTNLLIGVVAAGFGVTTGAFDVLAALGIGAAGYGLSITLWVRGAQRLGAARAQVVFATGPFIGAAIAWSLLGEPATFRQAVATVLAAAGVALAYKSAHVHRHHHGPLVHDHEHDHRDEHHAHLHHPYDSGHDDRHRHLHRHVAITHAHEHVPDLHHRHDH